MADNRLEASRNFANKIWNASRFVMKSLETGQTNLKIDPDKLPLEDRWILSRLKQNHMQLHQFNERFSVRRSSTADLRFPVERVSVIGTLRWPDSP